MTNDDIKMMTYLFIDLYHFLCKTFNSKLMTFCNREYM